MGEIIELVARVLVRHACEMCSDAASSCGTLVFVDSRFRRSEGLEGEDMDDDGLE